MPKIVSIASFIVEADCGCPYRASNSSGGLPTSTSAEGGAVEAVTLTGGGGAYMTPEDIASGASANIAGGASANIRATGGVMKVPGNGARDAKSHWALANLTSNTGECSEDPNRPPGAPCSSKRVVEAVTQFVKNVASGTSVGVHAGEHVGMSTGSGADADADDKKLLPSAPTKSAEVIKVAAKVLNCTSESCVVSHPQFVQFAEKKLGLPSESIMADNERQFKTAGPRDTTELLNNTHIDDTLHRWARVFPDLYTYDFAMMDFEKTGEPFDTLDVVDILEGKIPQDLGPGFSPVKRPAKCLTCVLNTDYSTGPGKHWVAAFVDTRGRGSIPWTVEYFNSAGRPPPKAMVGWMERTRARLEGYRKAHAAELGSGPVLSVAVTGIAHQNGQTECGLYSLFYIRKRAEGTPYSFFQGDMIPDKVMTEFRPHVFRKV